MVHAYAPTNQAEIAEAHRTRSEAAAITGSGPMPPLIPIVAALAVTTAATQPTALGTEAPSFCSQDGWARVLAGIFDLGCFWGACVDAAQGG